MERQYPTWPIGLKVIRKQGKGWLCRCPAHDDKDASLSLELAPGGRYGRDRVLAFCHAGCSFQAVVSAIGCSLNDLEVALAGCVPVHREPRSKPTPVAGKRRGKITQTYDYRDENGQLLYQVCRMEPKDFLQRQPSGKGWTWNTKGVRKVLYRLDELAKLPPGSLVFMCEGEKDVDLLVDRGLHATTSPGGASNFDPEMANPLAGQRVVILPDNDHPGRKYAATVAKALRPIAESVQTVYLPHLPEKGDVTDYFANGGSVWQLFKMVFGGKLSEA